MLTLGQSERIRSYKNALSSRKFINSNLAAESAKNKNQYSTDYMVGIF
jgi:hypothetical protein